MTLDNWLSSNICDRLTNPAVDFRVSVKMSFTDKLSFEQAVKETIDILIAEDKTLYLGVSGGIDSEYVLRKFVEHKAPFVPVVVRSTCNMNEYEIAEKLCNELNLIPTIIDITEADFVSVYRTQILGKLNGVGHYGSSSYTVAKYAKEHDGLYVKSEHLISDENDIMVVGTNEWDFYNDALHGDITRYFFMHTPNIAWSMIEEMKGIDGQAFKCKLYGIPYREKIRPILNPIYLEYVRKLKRDRPFKPRWDSVIGTREFFLENYFIV